MTAQYAQPYVKIDILESAIESQLITSILVEREIPHCLRSFHDTAYDGLFQMQKGWGELSAPVQYKDEIMEIITAVRNPPAESLTDPDPHIIP